MPLSVSKPALVATSTRGVTPTLITTTSAGSTRPSSSTSASMELAHPCAHAQRDTVLGVQGTEQPSNLVAQDSVQRNRRGVDEYDIGTDLSGGRGDLRADPAGADDRDPGRGTDGISQTDGVVSGAKQMDPGELGSGYPESARRGSGGENEAVEGDVVTAIQHDPSGVRIERSHAVGDELDVVLGIEPVGMDMRDVELGFAA
jgi:hypothetical protein